MNIIYSTNNSDYQPLSSGTNYLYDSYDRVQTFLSNRLDKDDLKRLAKPVKQDSRVFTWYGDFENDLNFSPLSSFNEQTRNTVLIAAKDFSKKTHKIINELKNTNTRETLEWAGLLENIFNDNHCEVISNGAEWALIWGWKMRKKSNLIPAIFKQEIQPEEDETTTLNTEILNSDNGILDDKVDDVIDENHTESPAIKTVITPPNAKKRFWHRLKRFFQWISYRFWGLMLLILYTLLILCFCNYCCKKECPDNCLELEKTEQELIKIKERLNERCLSDTL
jgi:hypothetical protein